MASLNHATIIKGFEKLAGDRDPENFTAVQNENKLKSRARGLS